MPINKEGRDRLMKLEEKVASIDGQIKVVNQQIKDHCESNEDNFKDIQESVANNNTVVSGLAKTLESKFESLEKNLTDLKINHVVFKTRVVAYWIVGTTFLTFILQALVQYLMKKI